MGFQKTYGHLVHSFFKILTLKCQILPKAAALFDAALLLIWYYFSFRNKNTPLEFINKIAPLEFINHIATPNCQPSFWAANP